MSAPAPGIATNQTWSLESYFPAFDGPEYRSFKKALVGDIQELETQAAALPVLEAANAAGWADVFCRLEDLAARMAHIASYVSCLGSADAANEEYQRETALLSQTGANLAKAHIELVRALRGARPDALAALAAQPSLKGAEFAVERAKVDALHQMSTAEEKLAADLNVDGFSSWGRLYDTLTGKMDFPMTWPDGREERLPMSRRRSLLQHPDRAVRRAAHEGSNRVWKASGDTLAASINAISGNRLTLIPRRKWEHFLDPSLFGCAVSRETIDAMFGAAEEMAEIARRVLRAGARFTGVPTLETYDLMAPRFPEFNPRIDWNEAVGLVRSAFAATYPRLREYLDQCVERRWIESEMRPNKRPGGFCSGSPWIREQRVYLTFGGTLGDVNTLAHEIGHAWHGHLLGGLRPSARRYPLTLAETASTFCELLLNHGLMADPALKDDRRVFLLDAETARSTSFLLSIPMRYQFERRFHEERKEGPVPAPRLCALMAGTKRQIFGDALAHQEDGDALEWASTLHFFLTGTSFYNYPYTFGFLLSRALFAEYLREGPGFMERYERFLMLTGSGTCEEVVRRSLGRDIRDRDFWRQAIATLERPVRDFEALRPHRKSTRSSA